MKARSLALFRLTTDAADGVTDEGLADQLDGDGSATTDDVPTEGT